MTVITMKCFAILFAVVNVLSLAHGGRLKGAPSTKRKNSPQERVLKADTDIDLGEVIGIGCFSERATVQVQGYEDPVSIRDVQVGDHVLTAGNRYSPVYAFGHRNLQKETTFVQLETGEQTLELTGDHLVFLNGRKNPVRADSIRKDDVLRGKHAGLKVFNIKSVDREGVYAPFTPDGTVLVDGILASSYVSMDPKSKDNVELRNGMGIISQQTFVHISMSPFRLICQGMPASLSEAVCQVNDDDDGLSLYTSVAVTLMGGFYRCQSVFIQSLFLICVVAVTGPCFLLEFVFGAKYAPTVVLGMTGIWTVARTFGIKVRVTIKHS